MTAPAILAAGFVLDLLLGDPPKMPHIVVAIGKGVARLEKITRRLFPATPGGELAAGGVLTAVVALCSFCVPYLLLSHLRMFPEVKIVLEIFVCYQVLATKCLGDAARRVYAALIRDDLHEARRALGMIVGRDTARLDAAAVTRAAVETVAENTSDGVVAPMFYFALGGAPLAILYKAVNTMDSMLGYRNAKYLYFGRAAARLDDAANYVPARLAALFMILAAAACRFDWSRALRILARDGRAHASPNAGHPEAACAGALGIVLGGDSFYGGRLAKKPTLGDPSRAIQAEDIPRAVRLLYWSAFFCFLACCAGLLAKGMTQWN